MRTDILVVGGGVIGMSLAAELSTRGARVTVVDKGDLGHGCSYGNAGWLTPCFSMPLPMPGMLFKSIRWLLDPESPLYIKPQPSLLLLRWLTRFLLSMNERHLRRSVAALTEISKYSLDAYARLERESGGKVGFSQRGLLMVSQTPSGVEAARREMELVALHGVAGKFVDEAAAKALEPALTGPLRGGVFFPGEAHAEPLAVVRAFSEIADKHGACLLPRTEVFDFRVSRDRKIEAARTTRGWIEADQFVLAGGTWSTAIAQRLGLRGVPVMGGKGYAITTRGLGPSPKIPLMLVERKVAVTPRADSVRLAGTLELVRNEDSITPRRVDAILKGARLFLNVPEEPEILEIWRGLRPCTPDGVPLIGRSKQYTNLVLNTGHQMLGLQSAPGSARLAADVLLGAQPAFGLDPFRADRFS